MESDTDTQSTSSDQSVNLDPDEFPGKRVVAPPLDPQLLFSYMQPLQDLVVQSEHAARRQLQDCEESLWLSYAQAGTYRHEFHTLQLLLQLGLCQQQESAVRQSIAESAFEIANHFQHNRPHSTPVSKTEVELPLQMDSHLQHQLEVLQESQVAAMQATLRLLLAEESAARFRFVDFELECRQDVKSLKLTDLRQFTQWDLQLTTSRKAAENQVKEAIAELRASFEEHSRGLLRENKSLREENLQLARHLDASASTALQSQEAGQRYLIADAAAECVTALRVAMLHERELLTQIEMDFFTHKLQTAADISRLETLLHSERFDTSTASHTYMEQGYVGDEAFGRAELQRHEADYRGTLRHMLQFGCGVLQACEGQVAAVLQEHQASTSHLTALLQARGMDDADYHDRLMQQQRERETELQQLQYLLDTERERHVHDLQHFTSLLHGHEKHTRIVIVDFEMELRRMLRLLQLQDGQKRGEQDERGTHDLTRMQLQDLKAELSTFQLPTASVIHETNTSELTKLSREVVLLQNKLVRYEGPQLLDELQEQEYYHRRALEQPMRLALHTVCQVSEELWNIHSKRNQWLVNMGYEQEEQLQEYMQRMQQMQWALDSEQAQAEQFTASQQALLEELAAVKREAADEIDELQLTMQAQSEAMQELRAACTSKCKVFEMEGTRLKQEASMLLEALNYNQSRYPRTVLALEPSGRHIIVTLENEVRRHLKVAQLHEHHKVTHLEAQLSDSNTQFQSLTEQHRDLQEAIAQSLTQQEQERRARRRAEAHLQDYHLHQQLSLLHTEQCVRTVVCECEAMHFGSLLAGRHSHSHSRPDGRVAHKPDRSSRPDPSREDTEMEWWLASAEHLPPNQRLPVLTNALKELLTRQGASLPSDTPSRNTHKFPFPSPDPVPQNPFSPIFSPSTDRWSQSYSPPISPSASPDAKSKPQYYAKKHLVLHSPNSSPDRTSRGEYSIFTHTSRPSTMLYQPPWKV
eukprot:NODE_120_length_3032_cov_78.965232_g113_i0.p1 GENE.NODE_120_length_3032_cov_78.965232_g113_i0~~NODE_120_length_3032_cov_78.965232_g113_i0.p1  ORF type:complete len:983 (-),score=267.67 NODE_120_length_3032_cov_78.965232_g113_i0:54-3002(-)